MFSFSWIDGLAFLAVCLCAVWISRSAAYGSKKFPLPPGPKCVPIPIPVKHFCHNYSQTTTLSRKYVRYASIQRMEYLCRIQEAIWYANFISQLESPTSEWIKLMREGEVCFLRVLTTPIIVLNSFRVAKDLLEKRGNIYSGRPSMPMAVDL